MCYLLCRSIRYRTLRFHLEPRIPLNSPAITNTIKCGLIRPRTTRSVLRPRTEQIPNCFLAWKDAYWESRASRPIITLMSDDAAVPLPGSWQWQRALAILSALGSRIWHTTYCVPIAPSELSTSAGVDSIGDSIFTLRCPDGVGGGHDSGSGNELGSMVSV